MKMKYREKILIITLSSLFVFVGNVFAMMNKYPIIAGQEFNEESNIPQMALYFFMVFVAFGAFLLFARLLFIGLKLTTGGTLQEAKSDIKGPLIGMMILLSVYLIVNTINPDLTEWDGLDKKCAEGFYYKVKKVENGEEFISWECITESKGNLPELDEKLEEKISPCIYKAVIAYPEPDYKGTPKTLFDDPSFDDTGCPVPDIDLIGYKSVKILPKLDGLYIYDKEENQYYVKKELDNLSKLDFNKDSIKKIEVMNRDYSEPILDPGNHNNKIEKDYYYGVSFQSPQFREQCQIFDEDKAYEETETYSVLTVRSRIKENKPDESYIYLYPVTDCGRNYNKDEDTPIKPDPEGGAECGEADGNETDSCPPPGKSCNYGDRENVLDENGVCSWDCVSKDKKETVSCSAPKPSPEEKAKCGEADDKETDKCPPSGELCAFGKEEGLTETTIGCGWSCVSDNGDKRVLCFAPKPSASVDSKDKAECGEATKIVTDKCPPSGKLCSFGVKSKESETSTECEWSCESENGVNEVDCFAPKIPSLPTSELKSYLRGKMGVVSDYLKNVIESISDWAYEAVFADNDPKNNEIITEELTDFDTLKNVCKIKMPEAGTSAKDLEIIINEECGDLFLKDSGGKKYYDIKSIKLDTLGAVVIRGSNDKCLYFSRRQIERSGGCIGDLQGSDIYDSSLKEGAVRPKSIIVIMDE